jgi:hypothetical protein
MKVYILLDGRKFGEEHIVGVTADMDKATDWYDLEQARDYVAWEVE